MELDWFYQNRTSLNYHYGPWPLWDVLTNYTLKRATKFALQSQNQIDSPATLGFATGTLLILALSSQSQLNSGRKIQTSFEFDPYRLFDQLLTVTLLLSIGLIITPILLALACYKILVGIIINRELLNGADSVWALDADPFEVSKAVINVLALLEGDELSLQKLQNLVKIKLLPASRKLSMQKKYSNFGYFYWKSVMIDISSVVRILPHEREEVDEHELRALVSSVSNLPLPGDHAACWELLLGPRVRLVPNGPLHTALIFRVHHALGDGPALCRLLLQALADHPHLPDTSHVKALLQKMEHAAPRSASQILKAIVEGTHGLIRMATLPPDSGPLHSVRILSGRKQLAWSKGSAHLLDLAKDVHRATGAPFTAVLLAALTAAIHEYTSQPTPITLVVPARTPQQAKNIDDQQLENAFSMVLVQVPPSFGGAESEVRSAEIALRSSSRPATLMANSLALRMVGGLFPRAITSQVFYSKQCTGVLSNMPGPPERFQIAGCLLNKLIFWVPHRGTTGVGASALSFAGELTLSLALDEALLRKPEDANILITSWETHLQRLHSHLCFPK